MAGCKTVDNRIEKNQAYFDNLPVETRQLIRNEQVDLGFTMRDVRIALGNPDQAFTEQGEDGDQVLWVYTRSIPVTVVDPFFTRSRVKFSRFGSFRYVGRPIRTIPTTVEEFQLAVSFRDGQARSILRPDSKKG
ncbi:MAG: hypothetical protein ACFBZ8_08840 [Opitutales bacterium]